ncbi:MAG: polyphosphate polymerase domain-containing protein [Treponema sp.]|nr:polyphosphate polymerase domain-containing protein [Candidatus Treponema scatequi]
MAVEVFNRVEQKYLLSQEDFDVLLPLLNQHMNPDAYNADGKGYLISNLYFDTSSDELIIKSLEKPAYKEKLRLRSYGQVKDFSETVYLEIKKKFDGVVYKRRTQLTLRQAYDFIQGRDIPRDDEKINYQVLEEIKNMMLRYELKPKVFIAYERLAFFSKTDSDFRLTLDKNILTRRNDLKLESEIYGEKLLKDGEWIMEAKAFKSFPLWFAHFLTKRKIYRTSFSKYGNEFTKYKTSGSVKTDMEKNYEF